MFYKQNGIVAGILLLILFAGAIGLVSVQMDKTVNRMHYSVVEEMGEYRTELIRQDFQKTASWLKVCRLFGDTGLSEGTIRRVDCLIDPTG